MFRQLKSVGSRYAGRHGGLQKHQGRKKCITTLILLLMMLVMGSGSIYAKKQQMEAFGIPDSEGSWNSGTNTYSWTQGHSNLMTMFEFSEGELSNYAALHLTTSAYSSEYRVCFMEEGTVKATIVFYSADKKDIIFKERNETKDLDLSTITSIRFGGQSASGSIGIDPGSVYLSGHTVTFSAYGSTGGTVTATVGEKAISSGDIVADNTQVRFTAKPNGDNLAWKWRIGSTERYTQEPIDVTITNDTTVTHEFGSVYVNVYTNDSKLGEVNIRHGSQNSKEFHVTPWAGDFTIEATPMGHGIFDGWYKEADRTNKYEDKGQSFIITNPSGTNNYFAKFIEGKLITVNVEPAGLDPEVKIYFNGHHTGCTHSTGDDWGEITGPVRNGTNIDVTVADVPGYTFDGWYEGETKKESAPQSDYNYGNVNNDVTLTAKFTKIPVVKAYLEADFTDRGKGTNLTWADGTLTASQSTDNWANIFVFPNYSESYKNVTKSADNYSGFSVTAKGSNYRIIIYYNDGGEQNKQKTINGTTTDATQYYTWKSFGLTETQVPNITRIAVAGTANGNVINFSNASLYPKADATATLDFNNAAEGKGGNATWTVTSAHEAEVISSAKSDNMKYLYDFTDGGNMEGHNALEFTGIRLHTTGDRFRIIAYTDLKRTDNPDVERRFIGYVNNTGTQGTSANAKTQHFKWSDLVLQWQSQGMTAEEIRHITKIAVAGDDGVDYATQFKLYYSWLENISDYNNTVVCYGEEGGKVINISEHWEYEYSLNGTTATASPIDGNSRTGNHCIKLDSNATMTVKAPSEFSHFKKINIIFEDGSSTLYTPSSDNEHTYTYTNNSGSAQYIAKIEFELEDGSISESHTITSGSDSRDYWLYIPAKVRKESSKVPVLFSLHGTSNDYFPTDGGVQNYNAIAEAAGFIVVYPRGNMRYFPGFDGGANKIRGWDSDGMKTGNKDIQFFRDIVTDLKKSGSEVADKVDESRIYITGFSNGGMMTYAAANAAPDLFAAFASISGLPMNEFHLQTNGVRPVPFLHIHGTKDDFVKYTHMPKIVDNMVYRNGCNPVPVIDKDDGEEAQSKFTGDATVYGTATKYTKSTYTSSTNTPFIYYEIGTGIGSGDTGMGHNKECVINGTDSKEVIWNFLNTYTKPSTPYSTLEFGAAVETVNFLPQEHGWTTNNGNIILQYGDTESSTSNSQYVYHSLQLKEGNHNLTFTANNSNASKWVTARLEKIATIKYINDHDVVEPVTSEKVFEKHYALGSSKDIKLNFETSGDGEYRLTFLAGSSTIDRDDKGEIIPHGTTISKIQINTGSVGDPTVEYKPSDDTDFTGYFNYHNRLVAQWNFDLCDYRFFAHTALSSTLWDADYSGASKDHKYGTIVYTYKNSLSNRELTYNGNTLIPISAGLKFVAPANTVQFVVHVSNGEVTGTQLQLGEGVKCYVPYVENTYRNNKGIDNDPSAESREADYKATNHHVKRDILYVASQMKFWDQITNKYTYSSEERTMFNDGGIEYVDGLTFYKLNYTGEQGEDNCFFEISAGQQAVINRIGVNRNLTYSFFTENIAATTGYTRPYPGLRIIGSPQGAAIANIGATYKTYSNAIAMTYGGWKWNGGTYSVRSGSRTDNWGELTVHNKDKKESEINITETPIPTDGFPVFSVEGTPASSEGGSKSGSLYHPSDEGLFDASTTYTPNYTPWTLPCRGAYVKFEPTLPGVLNVHMSQEGGKAYYIVDEFGNPVTKNSGAVDCKMGKGNNNELTYNSSTHAYTVTQTDYVRYSFDVKPGKSYYIFSSTATKTGFSGFYFEPLVKIDSGTTTRQDVVIGSYELPAEGYNGLPAEALTNARVYYDDTYTAFDDVDTSTDAVQVAIGRAFEANKWTSICLPFSMNNLEMETLFGKDTRVVLLRDIQERGKNGYDKTTINFIAHENQDIIAGYPYFIYPTKSVAATDKVIVSLLNNDDYNYFIRDHGTTISSVGPMTMATSGNYGGLEGYTFMGSLTGNVEVKAGSYALSNSTGQLTRIGKDMSMKPYRAFLSYTGAPEQASAKRIEATSFMKFIDEDEHGTTTDIEDVLLESGIVAKRTDVYNLNGQIVRANTLNLDGLPKGAYIVNGKKYVVK